MEKYPRLDAGQLISSEERIDSNSNLPNHSSNIHHRGRQPPLHPFPRQKHQSLPPIYQHRFPRQEPSLIRRIADSKLALHVNSQAGSSRRRQQSSEGTVVINSAVREQREQIHDLPTDTSSIDDRRRQAELEYYELRDKLGNPRRRSMIRTVSKEDYLLGRGANPRTGLVTPGQGLTGRISSTGRLYGDRNIPSAKWRQRGDQWVSFDVEESSPESTPQIASPLPVPKVRRQRTPERFHQWNASVPNFATYQRQRSVSGQDEPSALPHDELTESPDQDSVPGSFPESPTKLTTRIQPRGEVADSPAKAAMSSESFSRMKPSEKAVHFTLRNASSEPPPSNLRASSATAIPRKQVAPADTGKELPKLPKQRVKPNPLNLEMDQAPEQKSFLGVKPQRLANLNQFSVDSPTLGWHSIEREVPCRPMNNGPYRPKPYITTTETNLSQQALQVPSKMRSSSVPAEEAHAARSLSRRSHIAEMMLLSEQSGSSRRLDLPMEQDMNMIPRYDNPPRTQIAGIGMHQVSGPRPMPRGTQLEQQKLSHQNVLISPFNTTCTNTITRTSIDTRRDVVRRKAMYNPSSFQRPPPTTALPPRPQTAQDRSTPIHTATVMQEARPAVQILPSMNSSSSKGPQAQRMIMTSQSLSQLRGPRPYNGAAPMARWNQSNLTGMQDRHLHIQTDRGATRQFKPHTEILGSNTKMEASASLEKQRGQPLSNSHQIRICSRCHTDPTEKKASNIDGMEDSGRRGRLSTSSANAPEALAAASLPTPILEVSEPPSSRNSKSAPHISKTTANILNVQEDLRDHSICCPECCKLECHEGCLGHPSPCPSPAKSFDKGRDDKLERINSSSTSKSLSEASLRSCESEDRKHKFSLLRTALKSLLWPRRAECIASKSSSESMRKIGDSPDLKATGKSASIPATFCDPMRAGPGSVVLDAARKTRGFDSGNQCDNPESGSLSISRRRKYKEEFNQDLTETDVKNSNTKIDLTASPASPTVKVAFLANESRKISASRPCSMNQLSIMLHPSQNRSVSATSLDVRVPSIDNVGIAGLVEALLMVPFAASRMWLRNNPQVLGLGWCIWGSIWQMGDTLLTTGEILLHAIYGYSKTGKMKIKDSQGNKISVFEVIVHIMKSILYMMFMVSLVIMISRVVGVVLLPLRLLFSMITWLVSSNVTKQAR